MVYKNGTQLTDFAIRSIDWDNDENLNDKSFMQFELVNVNQNASDIFVIEYRPDIVNTVVAWIIDPGLNPTNSICTNHSSQNIFANKILGDKDIASHGEGCKCHMVPTHITSMEWEFWGMTDDGVGFGYSSINTGVPPIPVVR
jgi:hypothetical protein